MYEEFELIEKISAAFSTPEGLTLGIGDDCAILDPGRFDLVTTDTIVEGVHFDLTYMTAADVGWKAIAVCLSDVAAMGGGPGAFFLNLSLGPDVDELFVDGFVEGLAEASRTLVPDGFEVSVGGGDVTASRGPTVVTVTLLGEASPAGPVTRSGALPGDRIALLGPTGSAAAGHAILSGAWDVEHREYEALLAAHRRPMPRVREGALLGLYGVPSAMIDCSDGLLQDLGHILKRSGVGASVEVHSLPRHAELAKASEELGIDTLTMQFSGGEDFELILAVPPARMTKLWDLARRYDWDVFDIGEIRSSEEGLRVIGPEGSPIEVERHGYRHFERR